jgi:hypothetical protein
MSELALSTKVIILECRVNADRDTVQLVEQTAKTLNLKVGKHESHEWVQLMHIRNINKEKVS